MPQPHIVGLTQAQNNSVTLQAGNVQCPTNLGIGMP